MNWIDKLEHKYKRFAISNLTKYLVIGTAFVFIINLFNGFRQLTQMMYLDPTLVLQGQIWRVITFIFIPPIDGIWIIPALYVFYIFGTALEKFWGDFRFNLYYLIGVLAAIAAVFLGGEATSEFLNMSLFLAFAYLYPNREILLFFVLPIKVKYLGWFNIAFIVLSIILRPGARITALLSLLNFVIFFGREMYNDWFLLHLSSILKKRRRRKFKVIAPQAKITQMMYTCCVCGRTSKEYPELKFSYCYKCGSDVEYCQYHINNHNHIMKH
ncbi:MAG: rhomboid family intramembrane serine protease [Clostridium sp.]|mgnify:CR=1 FL=1|nr:rhomboid family intramembrane serine protease [Clostridium sp.]